MTCKTGDFFVYNPSALTGNAARSDVTKSNAELGCSMIAGKEDARGDPRVAAKASPSGDEFEEKKKGEERTKRSR